jgi:hypothetical protein
MGTILMIEMLDESLKTLTDPALVQKMARFTLKLHDLSALHGGQYASL